MKTKSTGVRVVTSLLLVSASFFLLNIPVAIGFTGGPLGGQILVATECTCSGGSLIVISSPTPGAYITTPATKRYEYGKFRIGEWVLGMALPGFAPCLSGLACLPKGFGQPVLYIGTSDLRGGFSIPGLPF